MSESVQKLKIKIPNSREKLQPLFPDDSRGDFKVVFKTRVFRLQKAYLRLQSQFFKKNCTTECNILQIHENFDEKYFTNVLSSFYGATIEMDRSEIMSYYCIIRFLEIESLLKQLRKDMISNHQHYQFFALMQIAHQYSEQQIFQSCLIQLQKEGYEQLKYNRYGLIRSPPQLFKLVIKTHNRARQNGEKTLPYTYIVDIIKEYCSDNDKVGSEYEFIFELIDKNSLTSQQYKQIFLNQAKKNQQQQIMGSFIAKNNQHFNYRNSLEGNTKNISKLDILPNLTESIISAPQNNNMPNQLTLEMENTFEKKLNQELRQENINLLKQLNKLKQSTLTNRKCNQHLQKTLEQVKDQLKIKQKEDEIISKKITEMKLNIKKLMNDEEQNKKLIENLTERLKKIQAGTCDSQSDQSSSTTKSQILPAHLLNQIANANQTQVSHQQEEEFQNDPYNLQLMKMEQMEDDQLQQLYQARLQFDHEPIGIPKRFLPLLGNFISNEGFQKKKLTCIYRRSYNSQLGSKQNLKQKKALLFLICTEKQHYIGAQIGVQIDSIIGNSKLTDDSAFIFTLSKNRKMLIKNHSKDCAVILNEQNFISFGQDLIISNQCCKNKSYCKWPFCQYYLSDNHDIKWFLGTNENIFGIKSLQCYEIQNMQMEMVL